MNEETALNLVKDGVYFVANNESAEWASVAMRLPMMDEDGVRSCRIPLHMIDECLCRYFAVGLKVVIRSRE